MLNWSTLLCYFTLVVAIGTTALIRPPSIVRYFILEQQRLFCWTFVHFTFLFFTHM